MESHIYQGQFGNFTITEDDRKEVIIYRVGLGIAGISLSFGILIFAWLDLTPLSEKFISLFFAFLIAGLGVSLQTIHIYLKPLHNALKLFWLIGTINTAFFLLESQGNLVTFIKNYPLSLLGIGFVFASLTGVFIKEAFCFNRIEAKVLSFLIPFLLIGYMMNILPLKLEQILLPTWGILFLVFILNKMSQEIAPDIGDKSVFEYLKNRANTQ
ncbi:DUF2301 domain-containing membrane protein [Geminocystis sp. CENA526]|uniref:DUF2301 domain-containing membrane protein n=1 Tax=Geminocystis sp. CENA526 TaxID=1355871 RepID=UPI003D6EF0B8